MSDSFSSNTSLERASAARTYVVCGWGALNSHHCHAMDGQGSSKAYPQTVHSRTIQTERPSHTWSPFIADGAVFDNHGKCTG